MERMSDAPASAPAATTPAGGRDKLSMSLDDIIKTTRKDAPRGGGAGKRGRGASRAARGGGRAPGRGAAGGAPASRRRQAHAASLSGRGAHPKHGGTLHVTIANDRARVDRGRERAPTRGRHERPRGRGVHVRSDGTRLPY